MSTSAAQMRRDNTRVQMGCLYCGLAGISLFGVGFWILAGFIPPLKPSASALQIAHDYASNRDGIRIGLVLVMVAGAMTGPWVAMISSQLRRIVGSESPLPSTQLGMGMVGILLFIFPTFAMQVADFRPLRNPNLVQLANDMGWLPFVGVFALAVVQSVAIAVAVFLDREQKVFPRWLGYFNIWVAVLFVPASLIYFFKTGPFGWNGLVTFYVPAIVFGAWFLVMFPYLRKAILSQYPAEPEAEAAPGRATPSVAAV